MLTPEELARVNIDKQLTACGWIVQSRNAMNLYAARGMAVREFPLETGEAKYLLYVAEVQRRLSVAREIESVVDAGLVRAGSLSLGIKRSAFEGRL